MKILEIYLRKQKDIKEIEIMEMIKLICNIDKSKYKKLELGTILKEIEQHHQSRFYFNDNYYSLFKIKRNGKFDLVHDNSSSNIPLPVFTTVISAINYIKEG